MRLAKHILYRMIFLCQRLRMYMGQPRNCSIVTLGLHDFVMFCHVFKRHNFVFARHYKTKQQHTKTWSCMFNIVSYFLCNIVCLFGGCMVMQPFSGHVWCLTYLHNIHLTYEPVNQVCHYMCQHASKDLQESWCFMFIQKHL